MRGIDRARDPGLQAFQDAEELDAPVERARLLGHVLELLARVPLAAEIRLGDREEERVARPMTDPDARGFDRAPAVAGYRKSLWVT
jgi:hypothetical protein